MGYTHSWYRPQVLDGTRFRAAVTDFKKFLPEFKKQGIILTDEERRQRAIVTGHRIVFNGKPGCETFMIEAMFTGRMGGGPGQCFEFCKTQERPYDLAVVCALLVFKHHFGVPFKVSSNGGMPEWTPGIELVKEKLGYTEEWDWHEEETDGILDRYLVVKEIPCAASPTQSSSSSSPPPPLQNTLPLLSPTSTPPPTA